jgi:hypothetical protein
MAVSFANGCAPVASTPPATLSQHWLIGVERMHNDPALLAPYTNRFMAVLAGMPKTQVVYLGSDKNAHLFSAEGDNKLIVYPSLRAEGSCMEIAYTVFRAGQQVGSFGLVVPALQAGVEPDSACVDRAASSLYLALAQQGL